MVGKLWREGGSWGFLEPTIDLGNYLVELTSLPKCPPVPRRFEEPARIASFPMPEKLEKLAGPLVPAVPRSGHIQFQWFVTSCLLIDSFTQLPAMMMMLTSWRVGRIRRITRSRVRRRRSRHNGSNQGRAGQRELAHGLAARGQRGIHHRTAAGLHQAGLLKFINSERHELAICRAPDFVSTTLVISLTVRVPSELSQTAAAVLFRQWTL